MEIWYKASGAVAIHAYCCWYTDSWCWIGAASRPTVHWESARSSLLPSLNHRQALAAPGIASGPTTYLILVRSLALAALIPGLNIYIATTQKYQLLLQISNLINGGGLGVVRHSSGLHQCGFQFSFALLYFTSIFPYELPALLFLGLASDTEATAIHKLNNQFPQLHKVKFLK